MLPDLRKAVLLHKGQRRLFVGAYGFEPRCLGWPSSQSGHGRVLNAALMFRYIHPKGRNRISLLRSSISDLGASTPVDVRYDCAYPHTIEDTVRSAFARALSDYDEVVIDITGMTKLLILVSLCGLSDFAGDVRIVFSEAEKYSPTEEEYRLSRKDMGRVASFPSRGIESVIRTKCLSSIRMQGQPVTLIAFASFNEQLVRHMLGTISPHRLLLINGRPPRPDYAWRERATQEIHGKIIEQYVADNPTRRDGLLERSVSTLDYRETVMCIDEVYAKYGRHERVICAATGSKMQTVGLFFSKVAHPDIHVEYPTPDSYFVRGISKNVRAVYEIACPHFRKLLTDLHPVSPDNAGST